MAYKLDKGSKHLARPLVAGCSISHKQWDTGQTKILNPFFSVTLSTSYDADSDQFDFHYVRDDVKQDEMS